MDIGNIKTHSDLNFEVAQAKKNALEKLHSRQLMAYITDPDEFLRILIERNQETLNSYHQLHQDLATKRK